MRLLATSQYLITMTDEPIFIYDILLTISNPAYSLIVLFRISQQQKMNNLRYNFEVDELFIQQIPISSEQDGQDLSRYERFNQEYTMFLNDYLNQPNIDGSAPTQLWRFNSQNNSNNGQMHQITPEEQFISDVLRSQPLADDQGQHIVSQPNEDNFLNYQQIEERNEQASTQSREEQEPIPLTGPPPKITSFKMFKKDKLRNIYGLSVNQVHRSLDIPKNFRVLQKFCGKYRKRFGNISARDIVNLDIHKRNWTIQSGQVASYFYVQGADYTENCKRYLFGKYFIWFGRKRYALDVLANKRIKNVENRPLYYQTMSIFVQQIPKILQIFENQYNNLLGNRPLE